MQHDYAVLARNTRYLVLVSYFGLPAIFTLTTLVVPNCSRQPNVVIWFIHLLPMLLFLSGVLKRNVRTHVWLSFISLGYFLGAVQAVFSCFSLLPVIESVLIVQLFVSSMLYVRWRSRELVQIHASQSE